MHKILVMRVSALRTFITTLTMKKAILGIALLTTLTTMSFAGEIRKEKKAKKATTSASCDKTSSANCEKSHACCVKKAQA